MNYQMIYDSLIERARTRILNDYTERHHIIPKCIGGTDDNTNLVSLTPEEHYLAHQLLIKIYSGNHALVKAAAMMIPNRPSNKLYGWLRRKFAEAKSIEQSGEGNSQYGTKWCYNPITKESKKIKGAIKDGWIYGRYKTLKQRKVNKREEAKNEQQKIYKEYYEIYKNVGFEKFVEITNYRYSKQNLVQRFASLIEDFEPQNGKKR